MQRVGIQNRPLGLGVNTLLKRPSIKETSHPSSVTFARSQTLQNRSNDLAMPGKSQVRFGNADIPLPPSMPEVFKALDKKYITQREPAQSIRLGTILKQFIRKANECDNTLSERERNPDTNQRLSKYVEILKTDLGFTDLMLRRKIMNDLVKLRTLSFKRGDESRVELSPFAYYFDLEWSKKNATTAPQPPALPSSTAQPPDANTPNVEEPSIEYVNPPVNLTELQGPELNKAIEELPANVQKRLKEMAISSRSMGSDPAKAKAWIDATLSLPWFNETKDKADIRRAKAIMDKNFYGMDVLKNRILEEIAMRSFQGGNKGGIILVWGPPGTGKTAFTETLAHAMGRKFDRVSMAGIADAHDITGHGFTYVGSKPGRIIEAVQRAGVKNPVIQIDELDKVGQNSAQGNPLNALMAVLDPQQNDKFTDSYLNFPFDLSKVLFVCTANRLEDFPAPLLSRAEIIRFDAYLPEEKIEIATRHLIPKQHKEFNLPSEKIQFERQAVEHIINKYTKEGGVRKLEQRIQNVFRKAGLELMKNPQTQSITITPQLVDQWLANPVSRTVLNPNEKRIGTVNGLYYSEAGGGTLPVQVSVVPGRGSLILTGSLQSVMKESAQVALSYLKANADEVGISKETMDQLINGKVDIHIHYPDTATPKDGPSAGLATFVTLWSALSKTPVPAGIALTGEIDLHGAALPIGGILEKVSGAMAEGVKTVYLPSANKKDYTDLCNRSEIFSNLMKPMNIQFVDTALDLIKSIKEETAKANKEPS